MVLNEVLAHTASSTSAMSARCVLHLQSDESTSSVRRQVPIRLVGVGALMHCTDQDATIQVRLQQSRNRTVGWVDMDTERYLGLRI